MDDLKEAQIELDQEIHKNMLAYESQMKVQESYQAKVIAERKFWWEKSIKSKTVADAKLDATPCGFHAIVERLKTNHSKEMTRMNNTMAYK